MSDSGEKKDQNKDDNRGEKIKPILSPFSPFPFGSPVQQGKVQSPFGQTKPTKPNQVQTPFSGSPGQKLLLNSLNRKNDVTTPGPRLRGQELYGGPVMFGGGSSSFRRGRMLSTTPYSAALRNREREKARCSAPATPTPPTDAMSSTARVILDTLDKMSTPIQDARKIPVPRAEKRKMIEDELNCSLGGSVRRRPRLGGGGQTMLNGPPLRKTYSPVPATRSRTPNVPSSSASSSPAPPPPSRLSAPDRTSAPPTASFGLNYDREGGEGAGKVKGKVTENDKEDAVTVAPFLANASVPKLDIKFDCLPVFNLPNPSQSIASSEACNPTSSNKSLEPKTFSSSLVPKVTPSRTTTSANTALVKSTSYIQDKLAHSLEPKLSNSLEPKPNPSSVLPVNNLPMPVQQTIHSNFLTSSNRDSSTSSLNEKTFPLNEKTSTLNEKTSSLNEKTSSFNETLPPKFSFSSPKFVSRGLTTNLNFPPFTFSLPGPVAAAAVVRNGKNCNNGKNCESGKNCEIDYNSSSSRGLPLMMNHVGTSNSLTVVRPRRRGEGVTAVSGAHESHSGFRRGEGVTMSKMPDLTNNVIKPRPTTKQGVGLRDSPSNPGNRLPDLTASTGFGGFAPANELKRGSVMDILGKKK